MRDLYWVRHAPSLGGGLAGWRDVPADLSDRGALSRLSQTLPGEAVLVSSSLQRAKATADAIADGRRRLPDVPALKEWHYGAWEGLTADQIAHRDPVLSRRFWTDPASATPPGGESWAAFRARVGRGISELLATPGARPIIAVAHHGVILAALQRATGQAPASLLPFSIAPLAITHLQALGPGQWRVISVNGRGG